MKALLLLALVAQTSALPLPPTGTDDWLLAEVRSLVSSLLCGNRASGASPEASILFPQTEVPASVLRPPPWSPGWRELLGRLSDQDEGDADFLQTEGERWSKTLLTCVNVRRFYRWLNER